jgi:predicted permease
VGLTLDLYVPVTTAPLLFGDRRLEQRGSMFLEGLGRLRPGVSPSAAGEDLRRVGRELEAVFPCAFNEGVVRSIREQGPPATMRPVFVALLGVTGLVLLIACANVANLLLSRAVARRREIGVRLALGAGRGRLVRQLLVESGLLALGGAALGLLLTHAGRNALMLLVPPTPFPIAMEFPVNGRVLAVALGLGAATVVLFGLWPALRASRPDLVTALKGLPAQGTGRSPARSALVAGQVALAMVSLACAGLFLRAIERSHALDPGFREPEGVLLLDTDLRAAGLTDSTGPVVLDRILERIRAVPGVERAAASSFVPLGWSCCNSSTVRIDGYEPQPDEHMSITKALVTADYFETMRIDLVAGRSFTARDREGAPVAIVNEAFARRFWPGVPAVGRQFEQEGRRFTVVGVARDGRYRQLTDPPFALVYRVLGQGYEPDLTLHVRVASGPPGALAETVRRAVRAEHADLLLAAARTMPESMLQATIGQRIGSRTLAVFGGLALLLAAVGIYGVMAYSVSQRTREIGVRMALGADRAGVARLVLRQGARITAAGLLAGGALAFGAGRLLQGLLLGLSPADPLTFAGVAGLLALVALLACLLPARRAAAVDPVRAFRAD